MEDAGVLSGLSIERQQEIENKVKDTLISAYKILEDGGSSMDAVEFAYLNLRTLLYLMLEKVQYITQTKSKKWMPLL